MIKKLFKTSFVYIISRALVGIIGVILFTPLLTRIFSQADYGAIEIITTIDALLVAVLIFGLDSAVTRYYFETKNSGDRKTYLATGMIFLLAELVVSFAILFSISDYLSRLIFGNISYSEILRIGFAYVALLVLFNYLLQILRIKFNALSYLVLSVLNIGMVFIAMLVLANFWQQIVDITNLMWIYCGVTFLSLLTALLICRKSLRGHFRLEALKKLLHFGVPLISSGIFIWVLNLIDRFFIIKYYDLEQVGLYSLGVKITLAVSLIITGFLLTWEPFAYSIAKRKSARQIYSRIMTYYLMATFFCAVVICYAAKPLVLLLAPSNYLPVTNIMSVLLLATIFCGAFYVAAIGVNIVKKTQFVTIATFLAAVLNIALNFFLIPKYGIWGASIATMLSYFAATVIVYAFSQKYFYIPYDRIRIIALIFIGTLMLFVYKYFTHFDSLASIFIALAAGVVFAFVTWIFILKASEKTMLVQYFKKKLAHHHG